MGKENKKKNDGTTAKDSPDKKAKIKVDSNKTDTVEKEDINAIKEQLTAEKDRILRLSAEFENYKKRQQRESDEFKKFANEMIFRQLLTIMDNLERAIASSSEDLAEDGVVEGVKLTYKEMIKLFETFNVKPVEPENQLFDPNFHQAVTQEETEDFPENTVTKVLQKGYLLHDRLIRPAMVVVSKKIEKKTEKIKEK